ncbi:MAG: hypothetical protein AAFU68_05275, partial [Pseudomonadota bacterium]
MSSNKNGESEKILSKIAQKNSEALELVEKNELSQDRIRSSLSLLHRSIHDFSKLFVNSSLPDPTLEDSRKIELTKIRLEHLYSMQRKSFDSEVQVSYIGLRSLLLINGGALIAILAYLG